MSAGSGGRAAFLAGAILSLGSALAAQDSGQSPVAERTRCDVLPWTADTADVEVHLALGPAELPSFDWYGERRVLSPAQTRRFEAILNAFRARFPANALVVPGLKLPLDAADLSYVKALEAGVPSLWNRTVFKLHEDGRVSGISTEYASRSRTVDSTIVRTLEALGDERVLGNLDGDTVAEGSGKPGSLELKLEMTYSPNTAVATVPLTWIRGPRYQFNPALVVKGFPQPKFPPELREANTQGDVLVQVVVDSAGSADMRTAVVLNATHFEFARAVFDVLPRFRFHVAKINGCPVKQLVQMPFAFRLRR